MRQASVRRTIDFALSTTDPSVWDAVEPLAVAAVDGSPGHATTVRLLWSDAGLYARFDCDDLRLTCSGTLADGDDLWTEDVVELFLWPDESQRTYFEYELSPLGRELALLVPNLDGRFMGWQPWHYAGDRRVRRAVSATADRWTATCFVPFALLTGLGHVPPTAGTRWRANFCRIDHDAGSPRLFSWADGITDTFHASDRFATLVFG